MSYIVNFQQVGRNKNTWSARLPDLDEGTLYDEVKSKGGIMSDGIDFDIDEGARTGTVIVGGFRQVGFFSFAEFNEATSQS